jgi:uncharacterized low-complexity protein
MFVAEADKEKKGSSKMKDGACGAGQCGANMMPEGAMEKTVEGKCAGNKPAAKAKKTDKKTRSYLLQLLKVIFFYSLLFPQN